MKTISFSILFSTLQLFFNPLVFAFLQQFTAGENLRVAGDSAGRRRILTTLHPVYYGHWATSQNFQLPYTFCKVDVNIVVTLYINYGHLAISQESPLYTCLTVFVPPSSLVIGVSRTSHMVGGFWSKVLLALSEEETDLSPVHCGNDWLLHVCCLIVGIHASGISILLSLLMLLGWSVMLTERMMPGLIGVFRNDWSLSLWKLYIPIVLLNPFIHAPSCFANVYYRLMKTCSMRSKHHDQYQSDYHETNDKVTPLW